MFWAFSILKIYKVIIIIRQVEGMDHQQIHIFKFIIMKINIVGPLGLKKNLQNVIGISLNLKTSS